MNPAYAVFDGTQPYYFTYYFPSLDLRITTDTYDRDPRINRPAGNTQAIVAGKQLDIAPTNIAKIEVSAIDYGYLLSRNLTGTACVVTMTSGVITLPALAGVVGVIKFSGTNISIEIVSDAEGLEIAQSAYTVQSNCMYSLGFLGCTLNRQEQTIIVTSIAGNLVNLAAPAAIFESSDWECLIGKTSFTINLSNSTATQLSLDRVVIGKVKTVLLRRYCNRSYQRCLSYGNLNQFSGNSFLSTSSLNFSL